MSHCTTLFCYHLAVNQNFSLRSSVSIDHKRFIFFINSTIVFLQGTLVGFKGEPIHTFNKDAHALQNASYFGNLRHRHNIILLGDSLGDLDIAHGLIKPENLLTIGYLNEQVSWRAVTCV